MNIKRSSNKYLELANNIMRNKKYIIINNNNNKTEQIRIRAQI